MIIQPNDFHQSLEIISSLDHIAVDTETYWTTYSHKKRIIGVSVYGESESRAFSAYYPFRHEISNQHSEGYRNLELSDLLLLTKTIDAVPLHIYHNAKFDRSRFALEGLALQAPFFCTMLMSHMYDENIDHDLESLAIRFKIDPDAIKRRDRIHEIRKRIMWHAIPLDIMGPYACGDTRNTYKLWPIMMKLLRKRELLPLWIEEAQYCDALMQMELTGIRIDPKLGMKFSRRAERRMDAIIDELGFDPASPIALSNKLFIELGLPIYERGKPAKSFPHGRPKMGEPIIARLKQEHHAYPEICKVLDLVLEYRGEQKAKGTWYDGFREACDSSSRIHANYSQHGTVTTRLSSNTPNMEQLPRDIESTPVKRMLLASDNYELWEFDYNQIEYRFAGVVSNDPVILDAYRSGSDMHQATADRMGLNRHQAKTLNFTLIYLGGPGRVAETFGLSMEEARSVWRGYHELYKTMFSFADRVNNTAAQRGWIKLWNGRRRNFKFHYEAGKAWNSYVQGGTAQMVKYGMLNLHRDRLLVSKINNQVHDALWLEIPVGQFSTESERIKYGMEWPTREPERWKIPFPTESKRLA